MRLADFIRTNIESILIEWERFAKTLTHARDMSRKDLRDHAKEMLLTIADKVDSPDRHTEQVAKSKDHEKQSDDESWAEVHGGERQSSGFSVNETVSEFRVLRASVVSLWNQASGTIAGQHLDDLARFHEAIDQSVAESLDQYTILKETETRLFGAILLASPDPVFVLNLDGRFTYANKAAADLFEFPDKTFIGKSTADLGFPFAAEFEQHIQMVIDRQTYCRGEFAYTSAAHSGERFEYLLAPVVDDNDLTEAIVCISRDITERAIAQEKIWHNAHHDLLTGLANRRLFLDRLNQEIKHAKRNNVALAVMFMDIDGFKEVNDSLGHEFGDRLLSCVADRLTGCVREDDTVARLGGDEFTVILTGTRHRKDAELVAQSIIDALVIPFDITGTSIDISASIGITFFPRDGTSAKDLLRAADQAMYTAKNSTTDRICVYKGSQEE